MEEYKFMDDVGTEFTVMFASMTEAVEYAAMNEFMFLGIVGGE